MIDMTRVLQHFDNTVNTSSISWQTLFVGSADGYGSCTVSTAVDGKQPVTLITDVSVCANRSRVDPRLPAARGPVSEALINALRRSPGPIASPAAEAIDVLADEDTQLALTTCYELHYRSFAGVDEEWEWDPELLRLRGRLERSFVRRLQDEIAVPPQIAPEDVAAALLEIAKGDNGPSLSRFMELDGTYEQLREFCVHRSAYQLKEADPHTWMIPRLSGRAKAAAVT